MRIVVVLALLFTSVLYAQTPPPPQWAAVDRIPLGSLMQVVDADGLLTTCRLSRVTGDTLTCTPETTGPASRITFPRENIQTIWFIEQDYSTGNGKKTVIGALLGGAGGATFGARGGSAGSAVFFGAFGAALGAYIVNESRPYPDPPRLHIHRRLIYRAPAH